MGNKIKTEADRKATPRPAAPPGVAFTVGRDVFFANGRYVPETPEGKRLLTHELVHTVQQGAAPGRRDGNED